jgi:hypothetical protein
MRNIIALIHIELLGPGKDRRYTDLRDIDRDVGRMNGSHSDGIGKSVDLINIYLAITGGTNDVM